ncbi:MAG: hypothetical protein M1817_000472 [Caeruleum heppii]|nr:MAG: hypothetical protein M1817_000472 [Caeruleum heppii]
MKPILFVASGLINAWLALAQGPNGTSALNGTIIPANITSTNTTNTTSEAAAVRYIFYSGGDYVPSNTSGASILVNQMYVEQLTPVGGSRAPFPIVFFHGGGQTGATWLNTPDLRKGWASYFLEQGHVVYIVDLPFVGRSSRQPGEPTIFNYAAERVARYFTAPELFDDYPQAINHTQWPGNGTKGDPIFDTFLASFVDVPFPPIPSQEAARRASCALLARIGGAALISHALSTSAVWATADSCPEFVRSVVAIEPGSPPFETYDAGTGPQPARPWGVSDIPLAYDPFVRDPAVGLITERVGQNSTGRRSCVLQAAPAKSLINLSSVPVLIMTGAASVHITYDYCTAAYLQQTGVNVTYWPLADLGIFGNGHYLYLERNNLVIANLTRDWLATFTRPASLVLVNETTGQFGSAAAQG